ncbi:MAG: hypothetical protein AAGG01_06250 [Planctomycetota bacterium]
MEPSGADVHLTPGSPCIDVGSPLLPLDADGTQADMGAVPFDPAWITGPASYCRSTPTNQGCRVELVALGPASLTAGLDFSAEHAPPLSFGLFFLGTEPNHQLVPSPVPTLPNTLCVRGAVSRAVVIQSTPSQDPCGGTFAGLVAPTDLISAGAQVNSALYGQLWFRDPATSGSRTAMSSGVYLPIVP